MTNKLNEGKRPNNNKSRLMVSISIFLLVILFVLFPILNWKCFIRLWEAIKTFGLGFYYYLINVFSDNTIIPTTTYDYLLDHIDFSFFFPVNKENLGTYFYSVLLIIINYDYFSSTLGNVSNYLNIARVLLTFLMFFLALGLIIYFQFISKKDPKINGETKALKKYKLYHKKFLESKVIKWIISYVQYILKHKFYLWIALCILLLSYNVFALILEFFGYYFLFASTLNPLILYYFIFCLLYSLVEIVVKTPLIIVLIVGYILFNIIRRYFAKKKIQGFDNKNTTFVDSLGVATYVYGPPGCGKTKFMTDLILSTDKYFRMKAFGIMKKYEAMSIKIKFPVIRRVCDVLINSKKIDNRIQLSNYIRSLPKKHLDIYKQSNDIKYRKCFGYDLIENEELWDGIKYVTFDEVLQAYVEAYYLYSKKESLIYANYSIRYDYYLDNVEYLPSWKTDLFDIDKKNFKEKTQYCNILNFDEIRLGNKYSYYAGMIDCGIIGITEIDKERGNRYNLEGLNRKSKGPNLKNDLFNQLVKLYRHPSTVDKNPFLKLFGDLQRLDSLNVDLLDSGELLLNIKDQSEELTTLKFSSISSMLLKSIYDLSDKFIKTYLSTRNYTSLFYYFVLRIRYNAFMTMLKRSNMFGYKKIDLKITSDVSEQNDDKTTVYYLCNKKIYAQRYATDVYRQYFEQMFEKKNFKNNKKRFFVNEQYKDVYPSFDDFKQQNSFMINDIQEAQALKFNGESDVRKGIKQNKKQIKDIKNDFLVHL